MYLEINGARYSCSKRKATKDTVKYLSVKPEPEEISGIIKMFRDDGFLLSEDNADGYERKTYVGTCLTVTNAPEPAPIDPTTQMPYRVAVLEAENAALKEQLAVVEDALCELDMGGAINE